MAPHHLLDEQCRTRTQSAGGAPAEHGPCRRGVGQPIYEDRLTEDHSVIHLILECEDPVSAAYLIARPGNAIAQIVRCKAAKFSATEVAGILESRISYASISW
jgi:hypothetical protein